MYTALSQVALLSSFLLSVPQSFAAPNTFAGTYQSIIHSGGCNGPQIGSSYITLGLCVKSVDGQTSSFYSMEITGDDSTLYESSFPNSDCSGQSTDTVVATYEDDCSVVNSQGYTNPAAVSSADCDSTGAGYITYASSDDCGDNSKIVRCQVYDNGACQYDSDADAGTMYMSETCGGK